MHEEKNKKYRDRCHCLLLYPDNEEHSKALNIIENSYDYACILHDKDISDDGNLKKPHFHVVLRFQNAVWSSSICSELGIETNYIQKARNLPNALLYLIHANDPDKVQYNISDVKGCLKKRLVQELTKINKTESEKVTELFDFIESMAEPISVSQFSRYCASMGYWSEFRRSGTIFMKILEEHNNKFKRNYDDRES